MRALLPLFLLLAGAAATIGVAASLRAADEDAAPPALALSAERHLNLHRHAVGIRVGRTTLPGGGVRLRVVQLPPGTPDVRERLKPTHGTLRDARGSSVALQQQPDGTLQATVPASWLQAGVRHFVEVDVWSGTRRVARVEAGYLLP